MSRNTGYGENSNVYKIDGEDYVSVTTVIHTVLSEAFSPGAWWGAKLALQWVWGNEVADTGYGPISAPSADDLYDAFKKSDGNPIAARNKAGERGKQAHALLEELAAGTFDRSKTRTLSGYDRGVLKWWNEQHVDLWETIACEEKVYSKEHGFAGTLDLARVSIDGVFEVVDLKTHKGEPRFEDLLQVAAYGLAYSEMHGTAHPEQLVVVTDEEGDYCESDSWTDPRVFLNVKATYDEMVAWKKSA